LQTRTRGACRFRDRDAPKVRAQKSPPQKGGPL
jgi:hypothetical protein